jgi:hypothetical protein
VVSFIGGGNQSARKNIVAIQKMTEDIDLFFISQFGGGHDHMVV